MYSTATSTGSSPGDIALGQRVAGHALLKRLRKDFIGVDARYQLADGSVKARRYLDSAASTLMLKTAHEVVERYLEHYSNSHSNTHFGSRIASETLEWARHQILDFVDAPESDYTCLFVGNGATGALNKAARIFRAARPDREVVLVSSMEHHSNDLPHRRAFSKVVHVPLAADDAGLLGAVDLGALEELLREHAGRVAYIAVTFASNVTGIVNPIAEVVRLAHRHGAWVLMDAAQALPRVPLSLRDPAICGGVDAVAFSGHKTYAPGSPGALVIRKSPLVNRELDELGGGVVSSVYKDAFVPVEALPHREEAGTPNLPGALTLGCTLEVFLRIGMAVVAEHEDALLKLLWRRLFAIPGVTVYGSHDLERYPRVGVVSFNLRDIEHGLVTAVLNDFHNIALRSGCFCAHPYVRELLQRDIWAMDADADDEYAVRLRLGMVRASLGLYSCTEDVERLVAGLHDLIENQGKYRSLYRVDQEGSFEHVAFRPKDANLFDPAREVTRILGEVGAWA